MSTSYPFVNQTGNCILKIPGDCVPFMDPCGVKSGSSFNDTIKGLVGCAKKITTTTTSTSTLSTSSTTSTSTTSTSTTSTSTTSTSTTSSSTTTTTSTTHTTTTTTSTTSTSTTSTSTTSTTSTSTTSTSTTTHTTTTTTSTSTSTTTTSTTSTTTTSTTTLPHGMIYWGAQASSTPPNSAQIQAQLSSDQTLGGDISVNWTSFNAAPKWCFAAIPTAYPKTKWFDNSVNNGNIGGPSDLFATFGTVAIGVTSYTIYMTQFATQFAEGTLLQN